MPKKNKRKGKGKAQRESGNQQPDASSAAKTARDHDEEELRESCDQTFLSDPVETRTSLEICRPSARNIEVSNQTKMATESQVSKAPTLVDEKEKSESTRPKSVPSTSNAQPAIQHLAERIAIPHRESKLARRPGFGVVGEQIKLFANYFNLSFSKDFGVFHYDIDIVFLQQCKKNKLSSGKENVVKIDEREQSFTKDQSLMKFGRTKKEDRVRDETGKKKATDLQHQQQEMPKRQKCREIIGQLIKNKSFESFNPVYDGQKNLYTTQAFPDIKEEVKFIVTLDEVDRFSDFEVIMKPVVKQDGLGNLINLEPLQEVITRRSLELPQEIIMALDTVMCHRQPPFHQVQVGRSFFMINQSPHRLKAGIDLWYGYKQSVRLAQNGPVVIVDFTAKTFYRPGRLLDYASDVLKVDVTKLKLMQSKDTEKLSKAMKKLKIVREVPAHLKTPLTISKLSHKTSRQIQFDWSGKDVTIYEYFHKRYHHILKYPDLPCVEIQSTKPVFIPMEICYIPKHQPLLGQLSKQTTKDIIKQTAIKPTERFSSIDHSVQQIEKVSGKTMDTFGLRLNPDPLRLDGRVLPPPAVLYKSRSSQPQAVFPKEGKWIMRGNHFKRPPFDKCRWVLFSFSESLKHEVLVDFSKALVKSAKDSGWALENASAVQTFDSRNSTSDVLDLALKKYMVKFAVIVLSDKDAHHSYDEVKTIADIRLKLVTQCMNEEQVKLCDSRTIGNVILKLNSKLGGVNHSLLQNLPFFNKPIIVFGADVTHSDRRPSIAAVVGSLDPFPFQYAVTCRVQEHPTKGKATQEIILEMKEMCKFILRRFLERSKGLLPERILFFRDGVSEGQFETVLEKEVAQIREACNEVMTGFKPPITYIVVQKKHQTRFMPQDSKKGVGRMQNIPPGTVVDRVVTHPIFYDFFLCSHEGIQGTSKPAHYVVILDENGFAVDCLQKVCYHLCYMYTRCNRSISMSPPIMYADRACTRAKVYADYFSKQSNSRNSSSDYQRFPDEAVRAINNHMATFDSTMFFV